MSPRAMVVDDDAGVCYTLREILESEGVEVTVAENGQAALRAFDAAPVPLVVTDLRMPQMDGMELLGQLMGRSPVPRVVVITAHGSERQAVEAMKRGAYDYFRKPFDNDELVAVVRRALHAAGLAEENERLTGELALGRSMVFVSESMRRLAVLVARAAPKDVTVLISGESGTGKERVADAIQRASSRASKPYVRFNCAALASELAEAELFGHSKGAFTGAVRARPGLFGEADSGTILLDEVGELAPSAQAKLLRVLQEGEVRPVGEDRPRKVDVRVLAATHRNLEQLVGEGKFRQDLFYRLNVVTLRIPPLRERKDDIPELARHFLGRYASRFGVDAPVPTDSFYAALAGHDWPGNVRELENAIESLVVLSPPGTLDLALLPGDLPRAALDAGTGAGAAGAELTLRQRMDAYERGLVVEALRSAGNNRSLAAQKLGISRVTLYEKLNKYGLGPSDER